MREQLEVVPPDEAGLSLGQVVDERGDPVPDFGAYIDVLDEYCQSDSMGQIRLSAESVDVLTKLGPLELDGWILRRVEKVVQMPGVEYQFLCLVQAKFHVVLRFPAGRVAGYGDWLEGLHATLALEQPQSGITSREPLSEAVTFDRKGEARIHVAEGTYSVIVRGALGDLVVGRIGSPLLFSVGARDELVVELPLGPIEKVQLVVTDGGDGLPVAGASLAAAPLLGNRDALTKPLRTDARGVSPYFLVSDLPSISVSVDGYLAAELTPTRIRDGVFGVGALPNWGGEGIPVPSPGGLGFQSHGAPQCRWRWCTVWICRAQNRCGERDSVC